MKLIKEFSNIPIKSHNKKETSKLIFKNISTNGIVNYMILKIG